MLTDVWFDMSCCDITLVALSWCVQWCEQPSI